MNYRQKYLKYKTKYLELKGGMDKQESSSIFNFSDRINMRELEDNVQEDMNQSSCVSTDLNQYNVRNHWDSNDLKYDVSKVYYLPCEITKITKNLFMNNNIVNLIKEKIYSDTDIFKNIITMNSNITFYQDPLIFLKNNNEQGNDMVFIDDKNKTDFKLDDNINRINIDMKSDIDKGGNFIASPKIDTNKSVVFYLNGYNNIGGPIKSEFNKYLDQELVELNCSFTMGGTRHIDEVMTFMPYDEKHNRNKFKVWIYKIRNITFTDQFTKLYTLSDNQKKTNEEFILNLNSKIKCMEDINIKNIVIKIRNDIIKLNESSSNIRIINNEDIIKINMFDLSDMIYIKTNYFTKNTTIIKKQKWYKDNKKLSIINKLNEKLNSEINDNNKYIIKYLLDKITNNDSINNDIFNNSLFTFNIDELKYLDIYNNQNIDYHSKLRNKNREEIKNILYDEQKINLDIISHHLFNSNYDYDDNKDNFVMFPIDLVITYKYDSIITTIPIFNRIWYETDNNCIALFSIGAIKDDETTVILNKEKEQIKSYINPYNPVEYFEINTQPYNDKGMLDDYGIKKPLDNVSESGGNLHCLIKNKY